MSFDTYYCYHCGFTFKTEDVFFYINDDGKLEEYWLLMSTADLGEDSKIRGFIYDTYCGSCGKNIKTYLIMENDFSKDNAVEILKREIYEIANKQLSEICHIDIRNDCVCLLKYNYIFECFQDFQYSLYFLKNWLMQRLIVLFVVLSSQYLSMKKIVRNAAIDWKFLQ